MALPIKTILCATDFSTFSAHVTRYGAELAKHFGAELVLFHAVHFAEDRLYSSDFLERKTEQKKRTARADAEMKKAVVDQRLEPCQIVVAAGDPVDQIIHCAHERRADLVIAASHGLSGFKRLLLGTVVERLARKLVRPLLVIKPHRLSGSGGTEDPIAFRKIVAGLSQFSPDNPVLTHAMAFAEPMRAGLHLLHAIESPMDAAAVDPTQGPYGEVQDTLQLDRRHRLAAMVGDAERQRFAIQTFLAAGLPGEALASHARQSDADLVVVGVKTHSIIEKLLIGSTTETILRQSPCSVLTVPV